MKYMGSKSRIKKYIVPILQEIIDSNNITTYIEPFVGGANIIDSIQWDIRIGGDNSEELIELLRYVRDGGKLPLEVPKALYDDVRNNKNTNKYEKWYIGAIGFLASYNGRYFDGGYAKTITTKTGVIRNYYDEAKRNILIQAKDLKGIAFKYGDYTQFSDYKNTLIYCDIPYARKKQYATSKNFNHSLFYDWVRKMSVNNIVVVSELSAPNDFKCIWQQQVTRTQDNRKREVAIEKLFVLKENIWKI